MLTLDRPNKGFLQEIFRKCFTVDTLADKAPKGRFLLEKASNDLARRNSGHTLIRLALLQLGSPVVGLVHFASLASQDWLRNVLDQKPTETPTVPVTAGRSEGP